MIIEKIRNLYQRLVLSPEQIARKEGVTIGRGCNIGTRHFGSEPYLITIGDNVGIAEGVYFHTHGGARAARREYPNFDVFGKIEVKNWAYLGSGSHIMPGVTIGEGSIIAAGSIVTKSVPDNELWGGVPAKRISSVQEFIARNLRYNLNSKNLNRQQKKELLLSLPDEKFIRK